MATLNVNEAGLPVPTEKPENITVPLPEGTPAVSQPAMRPGDPSLTQPALRPSPPESKPRLPGAELPDRGR